MNSFDDREKAFERRFASDEALNFRALARRNKLLGLWAAELAGKGAAEADAYAKGNRRGAGRARRRQVFV